MPQEKSTISEGLRTGIGILAALKKALEETLDEAIARGDLSPERAKGVVRDAAGRVQSSLEDARDRLDLVSRREFEALRRDNADLKARIEALEARQGEPPVAPEPSAGDIPVD